MKKMKTPGTTIIALVLLSVGLCSLKWETDHAAKETKRIDDSLKIRLTQLEYWNKKLNSRNDSLTKFGFYLSKDYLSLKLKLSKFEKTPKEELLIDELNDLMFSGGDHVHSISNMADLGEAGAFFKMTKTKLDKLGAKYKWDIEKVRYVLR